MIKKLKKKIILFFIAITVFMSMGFVDNYFEIAKNIDIFTTLYKELNTFYVDETSPGELMKKGIDEMLESLDPYTTYIPETEIEDFRFMTTGQYGGIGAMITKRGDFVYISEPYEGFPAQKAGLRAGDKILEINGKSAKGKTTEDVSKILKGQPNTNVTLLLERAYQNKTYETTFKREKVSIPSIPYSSVLSDEIGYIRLRSFTRNCAKELKNEIKKLKNKTKLSGLILDLRSNPGGLLNESIDIVNLFVEKGMDVVSTKGRIESWEKQYTAKNPPLDLKLPLVVLINSSSASASEIVSGALQDLDRAVIIGQRSFGKGLVQQTRELSYNSKLKLTVAKYYIPSGRCIQALDYSNRNEDGSVGKIADSLMTTFYTKNGREVKDGGGILPDIVVNTEQYRKIIPSLINERLFFDFATEFHIANDSISSDFICSDLEFNEFANYISDKEYEYKTDTEKALEKLKKQAVNEKYYTEFKVEYEALEVKMKEKKGDDLQKSKQDIIQILTGEIMSRYYFQRGRHKAGLYFDEEVKKAIGVLKDEEVYYSILSAK